MTSHNTNTKIALITGGSRGLGRSMALALAAEGRGIVLTYRQNAAEAAAVVDAITKAGGRAAALQLDVGDTSTFKAFRERLAQTLETTWGRSTIDFLVNNAGTGLHKPFAETTEAEFDRLVNEHFKGVYFLTQTLLTTIVDGGRILNVSSGLARFSFPGASAYGAMKGAVEVLTRYMAKELGPRKISVNVVAPGAIATDFNGGRVRDDAQLNAGIAAQTTLGRVGLPDDVGGAVAAILADGAHWITAQRIEVSGGMML